MNIHMNHFHKWISDRARNFCLTSDWAMTSTPLDIAVALSRVDVNKKRTRGRLRISLGNEFTLIDQYTKEKVEFVLASPHDSDPENGRLSFLSPLGLKVVGLQVGDVAKLNIFGRSMSFDVADIRSGKKAVVAKEIQQTN